MRKAIGGWGVLVRVNPAGGWRPAMKPGTQRPISTHLAGARRWLEHFGRLGVPAKLWETRTARGASYKKAPVSLPAREGQLELFSASPSPSPEPSGAGPPGRRRRRFFQQKR